MASQVVSQAPAQPSLADCDQEPIHVPGAIQPHGCLFAFDAELMLEGWSDNAEALTGVVPVLGAPLGQLIPFEPVQALVQECVASAQEGASAPLNAECDVAGHEFDVIVHMHDGRLLLELELRCAASDEIASFALQANRAISRLRRTTRPEELLAQAVTAVRALTGFDRVMAYRFRHDDSGEVVAEDCADDLDPYLGRRYPASDIPAQARRLYILNTLRLIADVGYAPATLLYRAGTRPIDLSHAVLRSVSPIHIEYLSNMGVRASMSVSIVVQGRLWGLIACHHRAPRRVPHSVRMACDVIAQVIAVSIDAQESLARKRRIMNCARFCSDLGQELFADDDMGEVLRRRMPELAALMPCEAVAVVHRRHVEVQGDVPPELALAAMREMESQEADIQMRDAAAQWPGTAGTGPWVGLMALRCDRSEGTWIQFWRLEQIETVCWGGQPDKVLSTGPHGTRLTPRGSFDEWKETVIGHAVPWNPQDQHCAEALLTAIHKVLHVRLEEMEQARSQMLAILGHDLRDPLNSISMAAQMMGRHRDPALLGQRIRESSKRMQRLVSHLLDVSRIRGGMGLGVQRQRIDLSALVESLVNEAELAHNGTHHRRSITAGLEGDADPDRLSQVVANLLGNARHHGVAGEPIGVSLSATDDTQVTLRIDNVAPPIPDAVRATLFSPFKATQRSEAGAGSAHRGLGLGLYIAHQIVTEHGGTLVCHHDEAAGRVVFTVCLPLQAPAGSAPDQT